MWPLVLKTFDGREYPSQISIIAIVIFTRGEKNQRCIIAKHYGETVEANKSWSLGAFTVGNSSATLIIRVAQ
jgi:hypothetical protein